MRSGLQGGDAPTRDQRHQASCYPALAWSLHSCDRGVNMTDRQRVLILGGGTGGTITANRLRRLLPAARADITVIDENDRHLYQPGLLFVPFGPGPARRAGAAAGTSAARGHRVRAG